MIEIHCLHVHAKLHCQFGRNTVGPADTKERRALHSSLVQASVTGFKCAPATSKNPLQNDLGHLRGRPAWQHIWLVLLILITRLADCSDNMRRLIGVSVFVGWGSKLNHGRRTKKECIQYGMVGLTYEWVGLKWASWRTFCSDSVWNQREVIGHRTTFFL